MGQRCAILNPNPKTIRPRYTGHLKIPAAVVDPPCPKCGESNTETIYRVWRVADERGLHFECDTCSAAWRLSDRHEEPRRYLAP